MLRITLITLLFYVVFPLNAQANLLDRADVQDFISKMVSEHDFSKDELEGLFARVELKGSIIKAITRPAEGLPWYKYRQIFLKQDRINLGVKFWQDNKEALQTR